MKKESIRREKELVSRCVKGDKIAWDEFVDKYKRLIYSAILRAFQFVGYRNTEEIAGDLFQEVFASLLRDNCAKLKSFKWKNGCSLASWLLIISKNVTFDYMRRTFSREKIMTSLAKDSKDDAHLLKDTQSINESFLNNLEREERINIFKKALKKLDKQDLHLVDLIYFREYSHSQAAAILKKSVDAVYMQKKRIIDKLKKIIKGDKEKS
jgi:RNA polymerase sigma factor (sigma-70 family)